MKKGDGKKLNQAGEGNWKSVENVKTGEKSAIYSWRVIVRAPTRRFTAKGRPFPDAATPKGKLQLAFLFLSLLRN